MTRKSNLIIPIAGVGLVGMLALGLASAPSLASTSTATFAVTAAVAGSCTMVATPMDFGTYVSSAASTATATLTVTCAGPTGLTVGMSMGTGEGATAANRLMSTGPGGPGNTLSYVLYEEASRVNLWGDIGGPGNTLFMTGTPDANPYLITVYGYMPSGQSASVGSYTDTITATISY